MTRTALVTGARGQLARCMRQASPPTGWRAVCLPREELDITDQAQVQSILDKAAPDCIINTAAYTAVDQAESEPDQAWRVNAEAVVNLVQWCGANGVRLIHISTDFVFDGRAATPYPPEYKPAPLGAYGRGKLAGEREMGKLPAGQGAIVRTSWLYSEFGRNFVKTMLSLMAKQSGTPSSDNRGDNRGTPTSDNRGTPTLATSARNGLNVVDDQRGCPTSARSLAALIWRMVSTPPRSGLYHWHDGGAVSWYEFALEIQRCGQAAGLLRDAIPIRPIASADYPTAAERPAYSVMDRSRALTEFDMPERDWRGELTRVVEAVAEQKGQA